MSRLRAFRSESEPPLTPHAWLRYSLLRELLGRLPEGTSSFLEVGCGVGALGARLAARFQYTGYEPDESSYKIAKARIAHGSVVNCRLPALPSRQFDALGAFEVLEHQQNDEQVLEDWREWILPGGFIFLSVPANPDRYGPADARAGHFRRYRRSGLSALLARTGFDQITVWSYGFPLGNALETVRNVLSGEALTTSFDERTAASGRFYQPNDRLGWVTNLGTAPFRLAQRPFRHSSWGTGLIAMARRCP